MEIREIGRVGLKVPAIGLGCLGMSDYYGRHDNAEAMATIHRALDLGVNFFDTADMYGAGHNEMLIGRAISKRRHEAILATKFGNVFDAGGNFVRVNGRPEYVRAACDESLKRLGVEVIDLYYQHRVDPETPIEETVGAMARLVEDGKVRFIGLSEAGAQTIRRAHRVHPISALQTEYSVWSRDPEMALLSVCRELGIGFVAYCPLGRGFLTGEIKRLDELAADDCRHNSPRFQSGNLEKNLELVTRLERLAREKKCTAAQLAIAWVLAQGKHIATIPGTKRRRYLEENIEALTVKLTAMDLDRVDELAPRDAAAGRRYADRFMSLVDG